jgi:glycosyl transferase family 87
VTGRARVLTALCIVIGVLYFAKAMYRGASFTRGDFYFSLPGEYAARLNPSLWVSPDLEEARAFNHGAYMYGPSQYLTLFPIVFLNSYRAIAATLLVVYAAVAIGAWYLLWNLLSDGEERTAAMGAALFALMFAFLPMTQALIQREFEVVALLALVAACACYARGRDTASGALVAYLTWFKYWPIVLIGTFVLHRRVKALAGFAAGSVAILGAAHLLFGLPNFLISRTAFIVEGLVRPLGSGYRLYPAMERGALKSDFCRQWIEGRGTAADVRWMLCGVQDRFPALPAKATFYAIAIVTAVAFVAGALVIAARPQTASIAKWSAIWEFSLLTIAGGAFVHAHYYYFVALVLPLGALAFWYAQHPQPHRRTKVALWALCYTLLNALLFPTTWLSAIMQRNMWTVYLDSGLCLLGVLLLLALVLWEFLRLTSGSQLLAES